MPRIRAELRRRVVRAPGSVSTLVLLAVVSLPGCAPGVRWELGTFQDIHPRSQAANKLTFVYFRNWYSVDCTRFEDNVLKNPEVLAETESVVCVALSFDYDRPLAEHWKLKAAPAFVIVAPDGQVLARGQAPITLPELLDAMRAAKAEFTATTQPGTQPTQPTPP